MIVAGKTRGGFQAHQTSDSSNPNRAAATPARHRRAVEAVRVERGDSGGFGSAVRVPVHLGRFRAWGRHDEGTTERMGELVDERLAADSRAGVTGFPPRDSHEPAGMVVSADEH